MTDSKGGCVWEPTLGGKQLLFNQGGTSGTVATDMLQSDVPIPLKSGEFHTFDATKTTVIVLAGNVLSTYDDETVDNRTRFALGDINNLTGLYADHYGIGISSNPSFHIAFGGTPAIGVAGAAQSEIDVLNPLQVYPVGYSTEGLPVSVLAGYYNAQDMFVRGVYHPTVLPDCDAYTLDAYVDQINAPKVVTTTLCNTSTLWQPNPCLRFAKFALYGYAIFEFDTLPSDYAIATLWMAQEWKKGNRYIWPGWIGV